MKAQISFDPATSDDLFDFYGYRPKQTIRAVAVKLNNRILGIGGIYLHDTRWVLFSDFTQEFRQHASFKRIMIKTTRWLLEQTAGLSIVAVADGEKSGSYLQHFGFEKVN